MICLYPKDTNIYIGGFLDNGICVLDPSVCNVSEEAGGSYELYMEHPFDRHGKFQLIAEDMIIKAPVPRTVIPAITLPEREICTVNTVADFYQKLPVTKNKAKEENDLDYIRQNPTAYAWSRYKWYSVGAYCVYMGHIYQATENSNGMYSEPRTPVQGGWQDMGPVSSSSSDPAEYTPGVPYSPGLAQGATVYKLAAYNAMYSQIRDQQGRVGFYETEKLTVTTTEAEVIPQQTITEQLFRVYRLESEETTRVLKVYARHISYDFAGNRLMDCKVEKTAALDAIAVMQGSLMVPDQRRIACEFEDDEITKDWSYKNPINALLDPDDGLVPELKARLIRNNYDFFILKNDQPRVGVPIEYGYNLQGVTWDRNIETAVTRVVPRCGQKNDGYLYLEHGGTWVNGTWTPNDDIYVDSPDANSFPFPRIEVLDAGFTVGDKYTPAGATEEVERTEENCREEMLKLAQERFTRDHCDGPEITLNVEFLLMGDTEQYRQYRGLQQVNLYDRLPIKTEAYETSAQVRAYEFNCLTGRYNSVEVGDVGGFTRRLPGYRVVRESITYSKLAPDVISRIRTMNAPSGDSTGSAGGGMPGSGTYIDVEPNTVSQDGIVTKGQGQANKVWKTDADGNPAWREDSGGGSVTVNDNDPTLAWGTRSKVGDVAGTDLHVTMPDNVLPAQRVGNGSSYDLNNLITGFVYWTGANRANVSNKPFDSAGSVFSIGLSTRVQQYAMAGSTPVAYRYNAAGTWSSWEKLLSETDIIDNLNSTSATDALSANQGNVIKKKFDNMQHSDTGTETTDSGGNIKLSLLASNVVINSVWSTVAACVIVPYVDPSDGKWCLHCFNPNASNTVLRNTSITYYVHYRNVSV